MSQSTKDAQPLEAFVKDVKFKNTQSPNPNWKPGQGANDDSWKSHKKISIDPYGEGRKTVDNYKLLTSGVVPRPVGFISTINSKNEKNLAPFSYFALVNSDPPIFTIGFSGSSSKDSAKNVLETGELTINIISEWFIEAANHTAINAPFGVDEWELSGLTPAKSTVVKADHVAESAFSIEAKLINSHAWTSKSDPERQTGLLVIAEGVHFHVREDVVNEELNSIDIDKFKPVGRLAGLTYSRNLDGYQLPRPLYEGN